MGYELKSTCGLLQLTSGSKVGTKQVVWVLAASLEQLCSENVIMKNELKLKKRRILEIREVHIWKAWKEKQIGFQNVGKKFENFY